MTEQELDKLFQSKLNKLDKKPSGQAWMQLETKLQQKKKKKGFIFWQIAAAVALLLTASFIGHQVLQQSQDLPGNKPEVANQQQGKAREANKEATEHLPSVAPEKSVASQENATQKTSSATIANNTNKTTLPKHAEKVATIKKESILPVLSEKETDNTLLAAHTEAPSISGMEPTSEKAEIKVNIEPLVSEEESIVITYQIDSYEMEDGSENKEDKRTQTKDKLLDLVRKVKEGETRGLASIRAAKDNLLSLQINKP